MDLLKRLAGYIRGGDSHNSTYVPVPNDVQLTGLFGLPPELIILITEFLPPASAGSLALCCRFARQTLGTGFWTAVNGYEAHRELEDFLQALERDVPHLAYCSHCSTLHTGSKELYGFGIWQSLFRPERNTLYIAPCYRASKLGDVERYIHRDFYFNVFQMAMKRYRLGLDHSSFLSLLAIKEVSKFTPQSLWRISHPEHFTHEKIARGRISSGSLLLQVKDVIILPFGISVRKHSYDDMTICPHIDNGRLLRDLQRLYGTRCTLNHSHNRKRCIRLSSLKQCTRVTKRLDLGEGKTPLDPRWWSHLGGDYTKHAIFAGVVGVYNLPPERRTGVAFDPGSIYSAYRRVRPNSLNVN